MMIFIVGVNHNTQYVRNDVKPSTGFKNYLVDKITKYSLSLIAEELRKETIDKRNNAIDSVARVTTLSAADTKHLYADPNSAERKLLGIPTDTSTCSPEDRAKYDCIREKYWLLEIEDQNCSNVLFICGDKHVDSFDSLLCNEGYQPKVLSTNYGI